MHNYFIPTLKRAFFYLNIICNLCNNHILILLLILMIQLVYYNIQIEAMKQDSQLSKITIVVSDPEARKEYGGAKQYYIYTLKGCDEKGEIDIQRRYSDFEILRTTLVKRWPGIYIPSLPSKLKITHSDEEFLQLRSNYFQKFLQYLITKPYIWYSEQMQFFLKGKEMSCEKVLGSFAKIDFNELMYRYTTTFSSLQENSSDKLAEQIEQFDKLLKSFFISVQQFRNKGEENFKIQSKYQTKYSKCLLTMLSKYENACLSSQSQSSSEEKHIKILSEESCVSKREELQVYLKECSSKLLFEEIKRQKREILAFQQSLKQREDYTRKKLKIAEKIKSHEEKISQLANGKQSFMSKIRRGSIEDDIKLEENVIEKYKAQLEQNSKLCRYIDLVLSQEIAIFKKERIAAYYSMIKDAMRCELELIQEQKKFWKLVGSQNQFSFEIEEALKIKNYSSPLKEKNKELSQEEKDEKHSQEKKGKQDQKEAQSQGPCVAGQHGEKIKTSKSEQKEHQNEQEEMRGGRKYNELQEQEQLKSQSSSPTKPQPTPQIPRSQPKQPKESQNCPEKQQQAEPESGQSNSNQSSISYKEQPKNNNQQSKHQADKPQPEGDNKRSQAKQEGQAQVSKEEEGTKSQNQ